MLKYEHITTGTKIRAWDFEDWGDRRPKYVEGTVKRHDDRDGVKWLVIDCEVDVTMSEAHTRVGTEVFVPMEMLFEYDQHDRVEVIG